MRYLMYHRPFGLSAKRLARSLQVSAVRTGSRHPVVVAWAAPDAPETALNGGIRVGKLYQLQQWKSADLTTPSFSHTSRTGWLPRSGGSFGGNDFLHPLQSPQYWTEPVRNVLSEFRAHVIRKPGTNKPLPQNYRVFRLGRKVNSDPSLNIKRSGVQIRSRQFGWHLQYFGHLMRQSFLEFGNLDLQCRWAISTLGWDFGAIDVLQTADGFVLLEANSAPSLKDDNTLKAYTDVIKEIIGE